MDTYKKEFLSKALDDILAEEGIAKEIPPGTSVTKVLWDVVIITAVDNIMRNLSLLPIEDKARIFRILDKYYAIGLGLEKK